MLTHERLKEILEFDSAVGHLVWRHRARSEFRTEQRWVLWNAKHAGKIAGCVSGGKYRRINIGGKFYKEHRLIWFYVHGEWPKNQIDHVSGEHDANDPSNLRDVTNAENSKNRPRRYDNKSGHVGVSWHKMTGKWAAHIGVDGKTRHLGLFTAKEAAIAARKAAERQHGFHQNHGRAA